MWKKLVLILAVALLCAPAFADVAYTNYAAWLAATPGHRDAFGPEQSLGDLAVVTSTGAFGAPRGVFPSGTNVWIDRVSPAGEVTTFKDGDGNPAAGFYAFGGFWDFSPGGWGTGLTLTLDNGSHFQICGDTTSGCASGATLVPDGTFFGVVTTRFSSLSISSDSQAGSAETFDLKGLNMVEPVPEPAAVFLFGTVLLAGGLVRKYTHR